MHGSHCPFIGLSSSLLKNARLKYIRILQEFQWKMLLQLGLGLIRRPNVEAEFSKLPEELGIGFQLQLVYGNQEEEVSLVIVSQK